ncbi:MFS transporter [Bosea psychrotolerans]|uniref:Putative MFS family arabinose efflux permease n=1 Tax=Bosea psychrotolerans TaxID=1871628 RepID=A0A2S4M048_9HYPH|nr:MFS transporter [Bosea psychrotolerans]POR47985.1 putative MFS family arabinose efflux permease [Bosea psychrotolerans]
MSSPVPIALLLAGVSSQFADKLSLDTISLAATQGGASPRLVGLLVAAQSAAWLLVSLPAGVFADRIAPRSLVMLGGGLMLAGSLMGAGLLALGLVGWPLGLSTFIAASGPVVIALSIFVLLPRMVAVSTLPRANGRLELGRACFSLAAPLIAGWAVAHGVGGLGLVICALAGLVVLVAATRLPGDRPPAQPRQRLHRAIAEGGAFVARHPYLRPIALCAIGWNMAFFAFLAIVTPYAARILLLAPETIGLASSVYGAGLIAGALSGPALIARLPTGLLLVFGPASSLLGVGLLALAPASLGWPALALAFFLFGFGPILWFITQTSLRQAVTPQALLGRVSATLTTAMYGMRPVGALAGGLAGEWLGLQTAMLLPVGLFALSTLAILASRMPGLKAMPEGEVVLPANKAWLAARS